MESIYEELEVLEKADDENALAWKQALGNQILNVAEHGMSPVGGTMFDAVFRNDFFSTVYWGVDIATKGIVIHNFIKNDAPKIKAALKGIKGFLKG